VNNQDRRVRVDGGKFTFVVPSGDYRVSILRYDEHWHPPQGEASNALRSIMNELDAARVVLQAVRKAIAMRNEGEVIGVLCDALEHHDRLVVDQEAPSSWTEAP